MTEPQDPRTVWNETLRLASTSASVENNARVETLLWVLGHIDDDRCPTGAADRERVRELTDRGAWPFDPSLPEPENSGNAGADRQ